MSEHAFTSEGEVVFVEKAKQPEDLAKHGVAGRSGRHKGSASVLRVSDSEGKATKIDTQNPESNWLIADHAKSPAKEQPSYLRMQPMDGGRPIITSTYSDKGEYQPGDHIKLQDDGNETTPFPSYGHYSGGQEMEITHVADNTAGLKNFPAGKHSYYVFK